MNLPHPGGVHHVQLCLKEQGRFVETLLFVGFSPQH